MLSVCDETGCFPITLQAGSWSCDTGVDHVPEQQVSKPKRVSPASLTAVRNKRCNETQECYVLTVF